LPDHPDVSIVLPTLNEAENIGELIYRVAVACTDGGITPEIIVVDDGSTDGTPEIVEKASKDLPVLLIRRPGKMGITSAILEGFERARAPVVGGMDADFSHPPEKVPDLVRPLMEDGADMTIGSRYVDGGGTSGWPLTRRLVSKTASTLSRPLTEADDPMSGFFFVRKSSLDAVRLNSRGWKICLEILVKAEPERVLEIPYTFSNRQSGKSKMGAGTIGSFLLNLVDLYVHKYFGSNLGSFLKFCTVGGIGIFINLAIVYALVEFGGLWPTVSAAVSFFIVALNNFLWNKVWTFRDTRVDPRVVGTQLGKFLATSLVALFVNLVILSLLMEGLDVWYLLAQLFAIGVAVTVNFSLNSLWVFGGRGRD
jgi:dolichol-phosphate mannosyltransferase